MTLNTIQRLCVYCGSGLGLDPRFEEAAISLGKDMAAHGIGLVYGGGGNGLMGKIAETVLSEGGHVTGIIPTSLVQLENAPGDLHERYVVDTLHERKMKMFDLSDGFVALAGGLGTLEELVEQLTWVQLGHHDKPVYIVNTAGYWDLLLEMFEHMRRQHFIRPGLEARYTVVQDAAEIVPDFLQRHRKRSRSDELAVQP